MWPEPRAGGIRVSSTVRCAWPRRSDPIPAGPPAVTRRGPNPRGSTPAGRAGGQRRTLAAPVLGARRAVEGSPPQPVPAALVAQLPSVAAHPVYLPPRVTRVCDRAGAGVDEDSGSVRKRGGERDLPVGH